MQQLPEFYPNSELLHMKVHLLLVNNFVSSIIYSLI